MPSRRRFIGGCAGVGVLALAGCTDVLDGEASETTDWHYDAGARFGASTVGTATVDLSAVREAPLPEQFQNGLQYYDEEVQSVDLEDVDSVAATGFLDRADEIHGGSVVVLGEFDVEALGEELEAEEGLEPAETAEGWDRYEHGYGDGGIAVREDAVVFGEVRTRADRDVDPVAAAQAAGAGDATPFTERENGETLHEELSGDVTVAVDLGAEWRQDLGRGFGRRLDSLETIVGATQAFGLDVTFRGETTDLRYVVVADPEELDVEAVREFLEQARQSEVTSFEEVSVSRDGRAIVATTSMATDAIRQTHENILFGRSQRVERTAPNATFGVERTDDDRARVTHQGGDGVERLQVVYESPDGRLIETWRGDRISAGDSYVTDRQVAADGTVRVVWESEDGRHVSTLAAATL